MAENDPPGFENWPARGEFYSLVGQGISLWTKMETALVSIFSELMGVPPAKGGLVLYSIINFNIWLTLITELFASEEALKPLSGRWNKKFERLRSLNDVRARLAHHTSGRYDSDPTTLAPSVLDTRARSKAYQPLSAADILEFNQNVIAVFGELADLYEAMIEMRKSSLERDREQDRGRPH